MQNIIEKISAEKIFGFESFSDNTEEAPVEIHTSEQLVPLEEEEKGTIWEDIPVPEGYVVNDDGVFMPKWNSQTNKNDLICICYSPIALSGVGMDIDTGEFWYEIMYADTFGKINTLDVIQEDITKRSKVCNLANKGINVVDKKASIVKT